MPHHANPPLSTAQTAPPSGNAAMRNGYQPAAMPPMGPGPGEEATVVLPRRPLGFAGGPPPVRPLPPAPSWGAGPGYPAAIAAPRHQRFPLWARIGAAAAVIVAIVAAGIVINVASSPDDMGSVAVTRSPRPSSTQASPSPTRQAAATVPLSALPGLLLDVATISSIEGATNIAPTPDAGSDDVAYSGVNTDRPECGEIQIPALESELEGTGWVGIRTQSLQDPKVVEHLDNSAAIYFTTATAASDFVAKQAAAWPKCNGATLRLLERGQPDSIWMASTVANRDGMLSIINTQEGAGGWQCQRAMTARNNIVIDVRSCGNNRTDQGLKIATRMADRVNPR
ncbi:hypothetical protein AWC29_06515 [Mycobacterium triplex]|jgi:serine/threonine-protein kinase|nr:MULTISPECIES: sensor domain-containing protein [Mycobacterium]OBH36827.1 hypothetical protein A5690_07610 [Mycobacterium intracellulare]ORA18335.1 sensor domain-containing protein [Mycobacterium arosiense ATCC BAA-1401 = DSM 45069]ORX07790.1 hypothetical protein AWC29_06515 [Mycobacterium triplex]CDO91332.1 Ser/Thr protein kinase [Mycobacterium triplex]